MKIMLYGSGVNGSRVLEGMRSTPGEILEGMQYILSPPLKILEGMHPPHLPMVDAYASIHDVLRSSAWSGIWDD